MRLKDDYGKEFLLLDEENLIYKRAINLVIVLKNAQKIDERDLVIKVSLYYNYK